MFPPPARAVYKIPNDVDIKETMKQYGRYKRKSLARLEVTEDEMRRRRDLYLNDETQKFERTQREGMLESLVRAPAHTTFSPGPHHDHHLATRTSHTPISFTMYHMHVQARGTISSATFLQNAQMLVKPEEPSLVAAESSGSTAAVAGTFCIGLIGLVRLCANKVPHLTHTHTHAP